MERDVPNINRASNSINLLKNNLGEDGLAHIATAWEQSNTLKSICGIAAGATTDTCGIAAGATTADLSGRGIDAVSARIIALELRFNRALISLNLHWNGIGVGGAKAIADSLPQS